MDQMEARGHFYKCLKENSQSKPAVNLSIYLEGREGRNPCCTSAGSHIVGRGFGKKTTESQSTGRKKKHIQLSASILKETEKMSCTFQSKNPAEPQGRLEGLFQGAGILGSKSTVSNQRNSAYFCLAFWCVCLPSHGCSTFPACSHGQVVGMLTHAHSYVLGNLDVRPLAKPEILSS